MGCVCVDIFYIYLIPFIAHGWGVYSIFKIVLRMILQNVLSRAVGCVLTYLSAVKFFLTYNALT